MLAFLQTGSIPGEWGQRERDRVRRRAKGFAWYGQGLCRVMDDGTVRTVPPPEQRYSLIISTHERTGHWGIKRTKHLLSASYWWAGMEADVTQALATCAACAQVKATFNAQQPELQPLPIEGLFYRWGVDLAGPFATSQNGNRFVMIAIEYFSKHIELVAIPDKEAKHTAHAFLAAVIGRFGACAEAVTDRGTEFEGEFDHLLVDALIDHRTTSPNHPQADGLAERCVQSIKKALAKHAVQHRELGDWDTQMHWIALGYRASRQASTGCSPYELMYGCRPVVPPAIRLRFENPVLEFDDAEQVAEHLLWRAQLLRERCVEAMGNLRIAQHRDTLRYQQVRSGHYQPVGYSFAVGDFVYVRRRNVVNTLQSEASPGVLQVVEVRPTGVLLLQGRCGTTTTANVSECAPCHLSNIDPTLDPTLRHVGANTPCTICGSPDVDVPMLLCDGCNRGYHLGCLAPPLSAVPEGIWVCSECTGMGVTEQSIRIRQQQDLPVAQSDAALFPTAQQRERDDAAQMLHGRSVVLDGVGGFLAYIPRVARPANSRCPLSVLVAGMEPLPVSYRKAKRLLV
jgi:transposase InsO family protein